VSFQHHARRAILLVDGIGLAAYCYWLATRGERTFYHTEGVFYLLPCVPLIFVFIYVLHGPKRPDEEND
jgi:hypothetical protein